MIDKKFIADILTELLNPDNRMNKNTVKTTKRRRLRYLMLTTAAVLALLVLGGCAYNSYAMWYSRREADRIANTSYGDAFETQDFIGSGKTGVLFLHGLYGTPQDFAAIMATLREHNIDYYGPMLGGERPSPLVQMAFTCATLTEHAEQAYAHLAQRCDEIVVVGFSLGAVQGADLACRHRVKAVVLVSPAFVLTKRWYVQPSLEAWVSAIHDWLPIIPRKHPGRVNDPQARKTYAGMRSTCTVAAAALTDYAQEVRGQLPNTINAPLLAVFSRGDEVIDPDSAAAILSALDLPCHETIWYSRSNHNPLVDYDRDQANAKIAAFILQPQPTP